MTDPLLYVLCSVYHLAGRVQEALASSSGSHCLMCRRLALNAAELVEHSRHARAFDRNRYDQKAFAFDPLVGILSVGQDVLTKYLH